MWHVFTTITCLIVCSVPLEAAKAPVGLLAEWRFDDGQGNVAHDSSGHGHDAQIHGANWVEHNGRFFLSLDGEDDHIDGGASQQLGIGGPLTIEAWIRPMDKSHGRTVLFGEGYRSYAVTWYNTDICEFYIGGPGRHKAWGQVILGQWNHVVATYDGGRVAMWINGRSTSTVPTPVKSYQPTGRFMIGVASADLPPFKGLLGAVRLYDRALSAEQIQRQYLTTIPTDTLTLTARSYAYAGEVAVQVDLKGLGPLPNNATAQISLGLPSQVSLHQRTVQWLESWGQVDVVFAVGSLGPGTYEVIAQVHDAQGQTIGRAARTTVQWLDPVDVAQKPGPGRRLNNLVTELLNVSLAAAPDGHAFETTRPGYIFIAANAPTQVNLMLAEGSARSIDLVETPEGEAEAMCFLPAGTHRIHAPGATKLIVRSVPELIYSSFGGQPLMPSYGPYDLAFLERHLLSNVNCLVVNHPDAHGDFLDRWRAQGKRAIADTSATPYFNRYSTEQAYQFWTEAMGMNHPRLDGIILNELSRSDRSVYEPLSRSVQMLADHDRYRDRSFYVYCSPMWGESSSEQFIQTVIDGGGKFAIERYLPEQPTLAQARAHLHKELVQDAASWNAHLPGSVNHMIVCFGQFLSAPPETLSTHPSVDFKVYMDLQHHLVANHPNFRGVYGIMQYTIGYADSEYVRWAGRLFRHYAIEGHTDLLSAKLGYHYELEHIRNPDFTAGTRGWQIQPAEPGSVTVDQFNSYGWLQGRYPKSVAGDSFLKTKRNAKAPNSFSQTMRRLQPGHLYVLKMISGDHGALVKGVSTQQNHGVQVTIRNVELAPQKCFQQAFANHPTHPAASFDRDNKFWMNLHQLVFRARGETAELTVQDWATPDNPGGPIGQELIFNFIEVQAYFD